MQRQLITTSPQQYFAFSSEAMQRQFVEADPGRYLPLATDTLQLQLVQEDKERYLRHLPAQEQWALGLKFPNFIQYLELSVAKQIIVEANTRVERIYRAADKSNTGGVDREQDLTEALAPLVTQNAALFLPRLDEAEQRFFCQDVNLIPFASAHVQETLVLGSPEYDDGATHNVSEALGTAHYPPQPHKMSALSTTVQATILAEGKAKEPLSRVLLSNATDDAKLFLAFTDRHEVLTALQADAKKQLVRTLRDRYAQQKRHCLKGQYQEGLIFAGSESFEQVIATLITKAKPSAGTPPDPAAQAVIMGVVGNKDVFEHQVKAPSGGSRLIRALGYLSK